MLFSSVSRVSRRLLVLAGAVVTLLPAPTRAQFAVEHRTRTVSTGAPANFFFDWDGSLALTGAEVSLPPDWSIASFEAVRGGFERLPARLTPHPNSANVLRLELERAQRGPIQFVLRATSPSTATEYDVVVTPLIESAEGGALSDPMLRTTRRVRVRPRLRTGPNRALYLEPADPVVQFRADALPDVGTGRPFTVEMWMKTAGLDCVVLSTWNGDEQTPYPLEMVVAPQGRLMVYRGRPGRHQAIASARPIADGEWHHLALTHEPEAGWTRLYVDGLPQDSLFESPPPSIPMPGVLSVGARMADGGEGTKRCPMAVDELRVWSEARSLAMVRQGMRTPMADQADAHVFVSFNADVPERLLERPVHLRRERTDLTFVHPVQEVRVRAQDEVVSISWETTDPASQSFTIERSKDGRNFIEVGFVDASSHVNDDPVTDTRRYRFSEARMAEDVVYYRIRQRLSDGTERVTASVKMGLGNDGAGDGSAILVGNYPNPFRGHTTIAYQLKDRMHARLSIWDVSGQPVAELVNETQDHGFHEVHFEAGDLPSGTYFVRLQTPGDNAWRTLTLTK